MTAMSSMSPTVPRGRVWKLRELIKGKVMEDMEGMEDHGAVQVTISLKWLTGLLSGPRAIPVST